MSFLRALAHHLDLYRIRASCHLESIFAFYSLTGKMKFKVTGS
jgi:hypothetical protein